jgi:two-component system, OmpR family, response regulator MprA
MDRVGLLLVEDNRNLAGSLTRGLSEDGFQVEAVTTGAGALAQLSRRDIDAVILDLGLPDIDGLEVLVAARERGLVVPVLVLTARDAVEARVEALEQGADDYLVKPFAYEELLARVRALLRRRQPVDEHRYEDLVLDPGGRQAFRGGRALELTALEFDLLVYFLAHPRQVLTRTQLLDAVWRIPPATASNVVDVYVGYLRTKLEASGEPRLLHTVRGVGYVLRMA